MLLIGEVGSVKLDTCPQSHAAPRRRAIARAEHITAAVLPKLTIRRASAAFCDPVQLSNPKPVLSNMVKHSLQQGLPIKRA